MAWGIGSIQTSDPQVRNVRNRLLGLYFGSMAVILGSFGIIVYRVVEYECNREVNSRLQQLAGSGTQTLAIIKHEYHELILKEKNRKPPSSQTAQNQNHLTLIDLIERAEADSLPKRNSALEITSRSSFSNQNKLEWFDEDGSLMMLEGGLVLQNSIPNSVEDSGMFSQHNMVRSYILPVYTFGVDANRKLIGYVRAGMSTAPLEEELQRLRWGSPKKERM